MQDRRSLALATALLALTVALVSEADLAADRNSASSAELRVQANGSSKKTPASFEKGCLSAHNKWRKAHQARPIKYDAKLIAFAQKRADFIAKSDGAEFRHPADLEFGENLAWHSRAESSCSKLVKMWYDEVSQYSFKSAKFDHETGHFTQLVWDSSERVGCARAVSKGPRGGVYLVCNYDPPGNFLGEFGENVKPKSASASRHIPALATSTSTTTTTTTTTTRRPTTTTTAAPATTTKADSSDNNNNKKNNSTTKKPRRKKGNKKGKKKANNNNNKKNTATTNSSSASNSTKPSNGS